LLLNWRFAVNGIQKSEVSMMFDMCCFSLVEN
jgi:hypothetical protein